MALPVKCNSSNFLSLPIFVDTRDTRLLLKNSFSSKVKAPISSGISVIWLPKLYFC